jgi:YfiH family protein
MVFPEIFDGQVMGFFSDRELGVDVRGLTGRRVYLPIQKHTGKVVTVADNLAPKEADAVITERHDILLGVSTADCVPILLFDRANLAIGAVHAGWRGTAKGILKETIQAMRKTYHSSPGELLLAIGPAIRWCCYEVGDEVVEAVSKTTGQGRYHNVRDGMNCLDLQGANKYQALSLGVKEHHISVIEECTSCFPDRYFSYRREGKKTGRQGGFIGMP